MSPSTTLEANPITPVNNHVCNQETTNPNSSKKKCSLYRDKLILAPMVRVNSLPFRLLCLEQGADLVYSEELIDHRLKDCTRLENHTLGTIDFVDPRGKVMLRTCPEERHKFIVQLGSSKPERALKAAQLVSKDVAGIDFNFGCPKKFSLKGGMGAAMLEKPDEIESLLRHCVEHLDIPVTCKIRLLPDAESTLKLVRLIESCQVSAIAVHGRTKDERPRHPNNDQLLLRLAEGRSVPLIVNGGSGDITDHESVLRFRERTGGSSVMIARAAARNPSIFRRDKQLLPRETIARRFLELAERYDNPAGNTKYTLQLLCARLLHDTGAQVSKDEQEEESGIN